jgi:hypothetical protein
VSDLLPVHEPTLDESVVSETMMDPAEGFAEEAVEQQETRF